jgi:hypothetical protein
LLPVSSILSWWPARIHIAKQNTVAV